MSMSASSADLKAQGNVLFIAKNFAEAEKRYTGAIEASNETADPKGLAVLYANRSACRLSLKRYMDADADATKATKLDPTYAKAWARLATAKDWLRNYPMSKENWQHALDALPKTNLKPAEEVQKAQYEAGLKAATAALDKAENAVFSEDGTSKDHGLIIVQGEGRMPWDLAAAIIPRLRVQRPVNSTHIYSSAWVIHDAYEDFMSGVRKMSQLQHNEATGLMVGVLGAVVDLTNGVMRDSRVMHFPDPEFISKYNKQAQAGKAWTEGGPELVVREALARQRKDGWDATRPALSLTIRAWIMRGVMGSDVYQQHDIAVEFYKNCLQVIRTLREHWILESKNDRGVIFEKTFAFGIHSFISMPFSCSSTSDPSTELLEDLLKESDVLISEIDEALRPPRQEHVDPSFLSSFYLYPRGHAYAMKGFYYTKMAVRNGNDPRTILRKAALEYLTAAKSFPEDDEHHPWFLNVALGNMLKACTFPLRETLDVMKRIRVATPKAKEIGNVPRLPLPQEQEFRDMIAEGKFTMDACIGMEAA
ncbi:hypothetical protein B0H13DRAFT_2322820 [Mycena leptocephala]|nr:hypothetical protein B0H13DRAFT_2322820 [Mycena leptocephala]